jgi:PAS domain S-box-containing protein
MADGNSPMQAAMDVRGHHTGQGRNVAPDGRGLHGKDIFFAAVQMTRMPMCMADPNQADMPIVFANEAFQRMTGYRADEVIGRNCRFLQGPDTDPACIAQVRRAIAAREDVAVEMVNYRRDGTPFWNALYLSPVFDGEGRLIYFFASQVDVTRRKEAEAVMQKSQRMEALGSMASGVAHEFNNLMTVVVGSTQAVLDRVTEARPRQQLARIEWAARQAGRLTQQMLSFARRQFHDAQPADLNALVRETDSLLAQVVGAHVTLRFDLAPGPVPVVLDTGQMELALINLARNAADAMPEGGTLTIGTSRLEDAAEPGSWAALTVADTGSGMEPEVMRKAVEPFFTTKDRGKGTGLGLSMVSGFVEQSGGRLELDSAAGQGTRVTILLPRRAG